MTRAILPVLLSAHLLTACQPGKASPEAQPVEAQPLTKGVVIEPEGFIQRVHDPVIAQEHSTYYVFSTGSWIPFICSKDKVV